MRRPSTTKNGKRIGRPPVWVGERAARAQDEICRRIANGETLRAVCRDPQMPDKDVIVRWLAEDPAFAARYAQAREALADHWADEIIEIADDQSRDELGTAAVQRDRLRVDTRKWIMAKIVPRKYSERIELGGKLDMQPSMSELIAQAEALGITKEQLFGGK